MARPHIEFVQAQHLPWQDARQRPGAAMKLLSEDTGTGAFSAVMRFPSGWSASASTLGADEEFFVLNGALEHGGRRYGPDSYAFWPAGFARGVVSAPGGAAVLFFQSGPAGAPYDPARLTEYLDVREGDWNADLPAMGLEVMASFARLRRLRSDPHTGEITYMTATMPFWRESQPERHPVIQEIFVLAGEAAGPQGIMRAGAYVWRPENVTHGPYGSTAGAVFLFRSHGGPQRTEHDGPVAFSFDPPHRPVLPPALLSAAGPVPPFQRY